MNLRYSIDRDNSAWRVVDGEAVLINAETTFYYGLNPGATKIWMLLLDEDLTAREIADRLAPMSGSEPSELVRGIAGFLDELTEEKLLTAAESVASRQPAEQPAADSSGTSDDSVEWEPPAMTRYDTLEELIVCGE